MKGSKRRGGMSKKQRQKQTGRLDFDDVLEGGFCPIEEGFGDKTFTRMAFRNIEDFDDYDRGLSLPGLPVRLGVAEVIIGDRE